MSQICLQQCQRLLNCKSLQVENSVAFPCNRRESRQTVSCLSNGCVDTIALGSSFLRVQTLRNKWSFSFHSRKRTEPLLAARAENDNLELCKNLVNVPTKIVDPKESTSEKLTVTFLGAGGARKSLPVPKDVFILDAAIDAGIDLPWSCRGGICGTCVGKVVKGSVDQSDVADLTFTLEQKDIDDGMALLCMSRPLEDCDIETQSDWGYLMGITEWKGATGNIDNVVVNEWKALSDD
eukprot:TRINITY_DN20834_c0_g1_i1.p1 TRINITY_DN20834_c0_g1~~TRINITY_DN20834_c0_g1_i1.p1  ORF type:complete len:254 (+),score=39.89 TRINITY_DN20834_c0_g1_i1:53-763(+)